MWVGRDQLLLKWQNGNINYTTFERDSFESQMFLLPQILSLTYLAFVYKHIKELLKQTTFKIHTE